MLPLLLRLPRLAGLRYLFPLLPVASLAMVLGTGVALAQNTFYVNPVTGHDTCYDGRAPVPSDLCPFPPGPPIAGPFRTITRAAQVAGGAAVVMIAGVSSGGVPVVYNAAHGESFPISPAASPGVMFRYDAANSTPGVLVTVDASGTGASSVFEFLDLGFGGQMTTAGIDGSTLGPGTYAIQVRGGATGIRIVADGQAALNATTLKNVRIWNNTGRGVHVLAQNGASGFPTDSARANPILDTCLFTQDTSLSIPLLDHLLFEANGFGWCAPTVYNCVFRVEQDAFGVFARVLFGIRMFASGGTGNRLDGTFVANTINGFSNVCGNSVCGTCNCQGIDYGVQILNYFLGSYPSVPTFTTCLIQNCGVTGFVAYTTSGTFNPTFSNCNFLTNGKRPVVAGGDPMDADGHGVALLLLGGSSTADFQYCLSGGNTEIGFHVRVEGPNGAPPPTQQVRFLTSQAAFNQKEGILLHAKRGSFGAWASGPSILNTKVDHNGSAPGFEAGLRLHQVTSGSPCCGAFSPSFGISNLLAFRNAGPGIFVHQESGGAPVKFNFITSARNGQEGIKAEGVLFASAFPEFENVTARSNWNGAAAPGGPYDVTGLADAHLRCANIAGVSPTFPNFCSFPNGFGAAQNLWCNPLFVNEATDDYHLVADQLQSTSLDTGKNDPVGEDPTTDLEGNARVTDFGLDGPNGNFPGNWADRACYERPN